MEKGKNCYKDYTFSVSFHNKKSKVYDGTYNPHENKLFIEENVPQNVYFSTNQDLPNSTILRVKPEYNEAKNCDKQHSVPSIRNEYCWNFLHVEHPKGFVGSLISYHASEKNCRSVTISYDGMQKVDENTRQLVLQHDSSCYYETKFYRPTRITFSIEFGGEILGQKTVGVVIYPLYSPLMNIRKNKCDTWRGWHDTLTHQRSTQKKNDVKEEFLETDLELILHERVEYYQNKNQEDVIYISSEDEDDVIVLDTDNEQEKGSVSDSEEKPSTSERKYTGNSLSIKKELCKIENEAIQITKNTGTKNIIPVYCCSCAGFCTELYDPATKPDFIEVHIVLIYSRFSSIGEDHRVICLFSTTYDDKIKNEIDQNGRPKTFKHDVIKVPISDHFVGKLKRQDYNDDDFTIFVKEIVNNPDSIIKQSFAIAQPCDKLNTYVELEIKSSSFPIFHGLRLQWEDPNFIEVSGEAKDYMTKDKNRIQNLKINVIVNINTERRSSLNDILNSALHCPLNTKDNSNSFITGTHKRSYSGPLRKESSKRHCCVHGENCENTPGTSVDVAQPLQNENEKVTINVVILSSTKAIPCSDTHEIEILLATELPVDVKKLIMDIKKGKQQDKTCKNISMSTRENDEIKIQFECGNNDVEMRPEQNTNFSIAVRTIQDQAPNPIQKYVSMFAREGIENIERILADVVINVECAAIPNALPVILRWAARPIGIAEVTDHPSHIEHHYYLTDNRSGIRLDNIQGTNLNMSGTTIGSQPSIPGPSGS